MSVRKPFAERILDAVNLPDETLPAQPLIEVCGYRRVLIENHGGVTEYGTERIGIRVKYGMVQVCGRNLQLCRMMGRQLIISGYIDAILLHKGADR